MTLLSQVSFFLSSLSPEPSYLPKENREVTRSQSTHVVKICRLGQKKRKHSSISSCLVNSSPLPIRTSHCLCSFKYLLWLPDSCLQGERFWLEKWAIGHALGGVGSMGGGQKLKYPDCSNSWLPVWMRRRRERWDGEGIV